VIDAASDREFDELFLSKEARKLARIHWTPLAVAARAAALLTELAPQGRVLDVGAGVGKFCFIGAARTKARFTGIEKNQALVDEAKALIKAHKVERVRFVAGDALELDWAEFDGVYLFNPFAEAITVTRSGVSTTGEERDVYLGSILKAREKMESMRPGARVATYFGYGGNPPSGYRLDVEESHGPGTLRVWTRV
jgi:SAM-dependent methyltransferase